MWNPGSLFTIVSGIFGTCQGSPPDTTFGKILWGNLFKWCGHPQHSFFSSFKIWSSRLEFVFLFSLQLPDSYSHGLAGWLESHMKSSPFFKKHSPHNNMLLHFTTESLPKVFPFPGSVLLLCLANAYYHLLPRQPYLGLDSMSLPMSCSFLSQSLKHYVVIHQLAKSHHKIIIQWG